MQKSHGEEVSGVAAIGSELNEPDQIREGEQGNVAQEQGWHGGIFTGDDDSSPKKMGKGARGHYSARDPYQKLKGKTANLLRQSTAAMSGQR